MQGHWACLRLFEQGLRSGLIIGGRNERLCDRIAAGQKVCNRGLVRY